MLLRYLSCLLLLAPFQSISESRSGCVNDPDSCVIAADISTFFTAGTGVVQTTGTYDNTNAHADAGDPVPACFAETGTDAPVNNSLWFKFTADGGLFHLETVPCNAGAQYISGGDTQLAVFQGNSCDSLIPVACNEDLHNDSDPDTDFRAGLDLQTVAGQTYYLLVDGYTSGGVVASGQFCIEITRIEAITCEQVVAGNFQIANNGFLCKGDNLLHALSFDASSFVIPSNLPLAGMSWMLTSQPIPDGVWPGSIPGVISTPLSAQVLPLSLQNNIPSSVPIIYYFTPVVVAGATLINPDADPKLPNLDISAGCYDLGITRVLTLVPVLEPLEGLATAAAASPGQNNGAVYLQVEGGYPATVNNPALYHFLWNTGDTTTYLGNLGPGNYTVTVSDPSGCTEAIILTAEVIVPVKERPLVAALHLNPNPGSGIFRIHIILQEAAEVEMGVFNSLGQQIEMFHAGKILQLDRQIDLRTYAAGIYFLRIEANGHSVTERIVVQR